MSNTNSDINSRSREKRRLGKKLSRIKKNNASSNSSSPKTNYSEIFISSPVPHIVIDKEGRIIVANKGSCDLFGIEEELLKRKLFLDFLNSEGQNTYKLFNKKIEESEAKQKCEVIITVSEGKNIEVRLEGVVFLNRGTGEKNIQLIIIDISEHKRILNEIKDELEHQKKINDSKDKFFTIIAHNLKSPFQFLLSSSEMLFSEIHELSKKRIADIAKEIFRSLEDLYNLLVDLLNWARIQRDLMEFDPTPFNFASLTNSLIEVYRNRAQKKGISIINKLEDNIVVYADENMISSAMQNFLANAIKFTQPDGIIILSATKIEDYIEISIFNTGLGIPAEKLKNLFKIESIISTMGTHGEKGTGLGLLLCKEFIEKNGGQLWATSNIGKGSDFRFTLKTSSRSL